MFPITHTKCGLLYPSDFSLLYDSVEDLVRLSRERKCIPRDIDITWANCLGFMRRIPDQQYHRVSSDTALTNKDLVVFFDTLRIAGDRIRRALVSNNSVVGYRSNPNQG